MLPSSTTFDNISSPLSAIDNTFVDMLNKKPILFRTNRSFTIPEGYDLDIEAFHKRGCKKHLKLGKI